MKNAYLFSAVIILVGTAIWFTTRPDSTIPGNNGSIRSDAPDREKAGPKTLEVETIDQGFRIRSEQQKAAAKDSKLRHDFSFTDVYDSSEITFEHHAVDDAGKYYKPVHYDHGNGVALADIDGDDLIDIYFTSQLGGNELYRNRGNGTFDNITESAGVGLADRVSVAASFADVDNDGDPDLFVTTVRMGNVMFENKNGGVFEDITEKAGLSYSGHSSGATFFDYDRDGLLDLFVTNVGQYTTDKKGRGGYFIGFQDGFSGHQFPARTENSILYRNAGDNRFENVSKSMNLDHPGWSGDATVCDVNSDGWPDLYVLSMQGDDVYFQNMEGKGFEDRTMQYFPRTPWGAMGVKFFDFNRDGRMDLFVTDMHSDMTKGQTLTSKTDVGSQFEKLKSEPWCTVEYTEEYLQGSTNNVFGNAFYVSQPDGTYVESSDTMNAETFWPWGVSTGDINADGFDDVFVAAGMGFGYRYGINSLLLNEQGNGFLDAEYLVGIEPRASTMKQAFVLACSGTDSEHPYCAGQTGNVPILEALSSRSSALVDYDSDGDLDIILLDMNARPLLLNSNLNDGDDINFVKITLTGTISNREAIGATVKLSTSEGSQTQYVDGKSGYLSQSSIPLYFGLGTESSIEQIEVTWPSGEIQTVRTALVPNTTIEIIEAL